MLCVAFFVHNWIQAIFIFIYCPVSERSFILKQSSLYLQPFMRHLTLTLAFSQFSPHYLFPFDPRPISTSSSSLHHCHSASNFPAIAAFPRTMFPTANLYSGRKHLSPRRLRSAAPSLLAPWLCHSGTCSPGLSVTPSEHFCLMRVCFEFGRCELSCVDCHISNFSNICDILHLGLLILTNWS